MGPLYKWPISNYDSDSVTFIAASAAITMNMWLDNLDHITTTKRNHLAVIIIKQ